MAQGKSRLTFTERWWLASALGMLLSAVTARPAARACDPGNNEGDVRGDTLSLIPRPTLRPPESNQPDVGIGNQEWSAGATRTKKALFPMRD